MNEGRQLLDSVTYLASLVSKPSDVDNVLDSVRFVTARMRENQPLPPEDLKTLQEVKSDLERHLVGKEKLVAFTPESLQIRLKEHFETARKMPLQLLAVLAAVICMTVLSAFFPVSSPDTTGVLVPSMLNSMLSLGGAYFFLTSIRAFTSSVRKAYVNIGIGFVIASFSQIVVPILIINTTPGTDAYEAISLWIAGIDLLSICFLYVGIRAYAEQTGVQSRLLNTKHVVTIAVAPIILSTLALLVINQGHGIIKLSVVMQGCMVAMFIVLALLMGKIARTVTVIYSKAAHALLHALILASTVAAYFYVYYCLSLFYSEKSLELIFFPGLILGSITCIMNLRAGYAFYRSSKY